MNNAISFDLQLRINNSIVKKGIQSVYHFSSLDNAPLIINQGLFSRKSLDIFEVSYSWNDDHRYDNKSSYISLSISYPNYKMLYKYYKGHNTPMFIIELSPSVLLRPESLFFETNAANARFKSHIRTGSLEDFERMFLNRGNSPIPPYTADCQAEVMVPDYIPSSYFTKFHFKDQNDYNKFCHILNKFNVSIPSNCFIWPYLFDYQVGENLWN